jgi:hypothetical protein
MPSFGCGGLRLVAALLVAAAIAAPRGVGAADDHVMMLSGTWACRSVEGVVVRSSGSREGGVVTVHYDVERDGKHASYEDRYVFDSALNRWHVDSGLGGFAAGAAPWLGKTWTLEGATANGLTARMTNELLPDGDFRRTLTYERNATVISDNVERCTPGSTPPARDACIVENYPATTLEVRPNDILMPAVSAIQSSSTSFGVVQVVVSLDKDSRIVSTRVLSTPNPEFNAAALATVRKARFRTQIRDCKPLAADYIFSLDF